MKRLLVSLVVLAAFLVAPSVPAVGAPAAAVPATAGPAHTVTYDHYSLKIDGRRVLIQSAEFHYFRLPSPSLWRDVLEKYKAAGFNTVSAYFDWAYHSAAPGKYDFSGVRDVDLFLKTAEEVGLYVIARPGPYINAETSGGGLPAWLKTTPGRARSYEPGFREAYRDWLGHINKIIAPHQITRGGSVILYNTENEYAVNTDRAYMQDVQDQARAAGIDVPTSHNQCCDAASWTTDWSTGQGAVDLPGVDDYPQSFDCANAATTWGPWGEGVTERTRADAPVFAAEYQAGSVDPNNVGYDRCRELTGVDYTRYFNKKNLIASGATLFSYYMGYGGTSWGWLPGPNDVYTSYDYGAPIAEDRSLTAKYDEFKRQGHFLRDAAGTLTETDPATGPVPSNAALTTEARVNPRTGTEFVLLRHTDRAATGDDSGTLSWHGRTLPVRVKGRDAKVLVSGYPLGDQRLVLSSSEVMTHTAVGGRDIALLYGRDGEDGTTVLGGYTSPPEVKVLAGAATATYSAGELTFSYRHAGLTRVLVTGGGRAPLLLLLATDAEAAKFWQVDGVLVRGTSLVRSVAPIADKEIAVRADTTAADPIEVFTTAKYLRVNGHRIQATASDGSLTAALAGPSAVPLPALDGWKTRPGAPESAPDYDDGAWTAADHTTTAIPYTPKTPPVLFAEEYGFLTGNVWYRGRFTATGSERTVDLNAITGRRGVYLAWLNGRFLGSAPGGVQADADSGNPDPGPASFPVPAGLLKPGEKAVLSVLVENMGHNDDWTAEDKRFKQPRGLFGASVGTAPITWKIQGAVPDEVRGPLNNGGLAGERLGWTLPGYSDRSWAAAPALTAAQGVTWFRQEFRLRLPEEQDVSVALRFGAPPSGQRVLIFLNGWNLGQYGAEIGPQTDFVLPAGILDPSGRNTLSLAVIAGSAAALAPPTLAVTHNALGGVPVTKVASPAAS